MSTSAGPNIIENGLVLSLDPANVKSLNIPTQSNHGYSDWYCFVSATATYSIINQTGGIIYENNNGTITPVITATGPQRGTFTVTAGRTYYGSVPINLVVEDAHNAIAPLTMMGTQFWHVSSRNNPTTYYIYSPYSNATINFYDNTTGGLTATPTSTTSLTAGQSTTITSNNLTNQWISSNTPILVTATQLGSDKTILSPMSKYAYQRYQNYWNTTNNTTATNANAYAIYDSTYNVMAMNIADGSGGDSAQGLGLEYLSDTYSWGNVLSDYTIVFPYNATVTAEYWNGTNWIVWDTHTVTTGSITNPPRVTRDGTNGPGVESSSLNGLSSNMASGANLWRWVGDRPFYLCINDNVDDEFSVLGWMQSTTSNPRSGVAITNLINLNNSILVNSPQFETNNQNSLSFNGINTYINSNYFPNLTTGSSYSHSIWFKTTSATVGDGGTNRLIEARDAGKSGTPLITNILNLSSENTISFLVRGSDGIRRDLVASNILVNDGIWRMVHCQILSNGNTEIYINGNLVASNTTTGSTNIDLSSRFLAIGARNLEGSISSFFNGNIGAINIYNRSLSAQEIMTNFNALRGRYGI